MDEDFKTGMKEAQSDAREIEQEFDAEPVPRREFRKPLEPIQANLRDLLACAFAASGVEPEMIYSDADEALKHR